MKFANVGSADRIIRLLVGLGLVAWPFVGNIDPSSVPGMAAIGAGAILIITAIIRFCPIYGIFGLRTRPKE